MDLGCPPARTFFQITLPIIAPAVIAGWLLSFTLSLDDLVLASFTTGPGATTLPIQIYSQVRLGVTPEINAACNVLVGRVAAAVLTASPVPRRQGIEPEDAGRMSAATACSGYSQRAFLSTGQVHGKFSNISWAAKD